MPTTKMHFIMGRLLLARFVLLASGHQLRGREEGDGLVIPEPPLVDPVKNELQIGTASAKISTLKVKSVFAANSAQAAAAQANTARLNVEEIYVKTKAVMPELNAIKKVATKQAASANAASKDSVTAFKGMEKAAKPIIDKSKQLAVVEVKKLLKEKYHELSDWRNKVLTNPWEKGQVAGAKAAIPYFKMQGNYAASMNAYTLEAGSLRSQSNADKENAEKLAAGVEARKEGGDPIGAAQDQEMANALEVQSQQLAAKAGEMEGTVSTMRDVVPLYGSAANIASWNANYAANPDGLPPPPVDPNFAFTPAPP